MNWKRMIGEAIEACLLVILFAVCLVVLIVAVVIVSPLLIIVALAGMAVLILLTAKPLPQAAFWLSVTVFAVIVWRACGG